VDTAEFQASYEQMSNEELLCVAADRKDLLEEAGVALDAELVKRGLRKEDAKTFKRNVDRLSARDVVGRVGLNFRGFGKQFLGASNFEKDSSSGFQEFDSTLWYFYSFLPIVPIATVKIRRRSDQRSSIFWSFGDKGFTPLELKGIEFFHVALTYLGAAVTAYVALRLFFILFDSLFLR